MRNQAREAREEENRRHDIAREKEAEEQELKRKMETIALGRAQRVVTQRRRDATQATLKLSAGGKDKRVLELREKLAAKRYAFAPTVFFFCPPLFRRPRFFFLFSFAAWGWSGRRGRALACRR